MYVGSKGTPGLISFIIFSPAAAQNKLITKISKNTPQKIVQNKAARVCVCVRTHVRERQCV